MLTTVSAYGRTGGSARVRIFDWLDHLGLEAESHTYLDRSTAQFHDLRRHPMRALRAEFTLRSLARRGSQTMLLSRNASSLSTGAIEARLLRSADHSVYDIDDALMNLTSGPFPKERIWRRASKAADVCLVGNDYLADRASAVAREVVVVPSCVEVDAYARKTDYTLGDVPVAVWMGSPGTETFLSTIAAPLLAEHHRSGLRLRVVSGGSAPLGPLDAIVDREDWNVSTFTEVLASADLGIMPLVESSVWAPGKCAYKLLQYAAAGLPSIASPVGANALAVERLGATAAADEAEWAQALAELVDASASTRNALGTRARAGVAEHYSFAAWAPVWRAAVLGS